LSGPYCQNCGQHDLDYHKSIVPLAEDALEGFLHFDGKFFKSVKYLFLRPGFLTLEFIAGRRTRYSNPLRFYIFASFIFFASGVLTQHTAKPKNPAEAKAVGEGASGTTANPELKDNALQKKAVDSAPSSGPGSKWGWLNTKIKGVSNAEGDLDKGALSREIAHLLPTMLFLCMPLLALVLKMVYFRSGRLYIEHAIFALHVMTLIFLASLLTDLAKALAELIGDGTAQFVAFASFCLSAWLVFRSFRVVYGQGKAKTLLKLSLVACAYGLILLMGMAAISVASFYIVSRGA
jgi:Protein of unknown function (DUF3667)